MGIFYLIGSGERDSIVDSKGVQVLPSAKETKIVFQASDEMTDSESDQMSKPQG